MDRKIERDQRVCRPIKQPDGQAIMPGNTDLLPGGRDPAKKLVGASVQTAQQLAFVLLAELVEMAKIPNRLGQSMAAVQDGVPLRLTQHGNKRDPLRNSE